MASRLASVVLFSLQLLSSHASPVGPREDGNKCRRTKVAVLGAGLAGISAGKALSDHCVTDFLVVEYTDRIGGRIFNKPSGKDAHGEPYSVEVGGNWIHGTEEEGGPENPIWALVQKYNVLNHPTDATSLLTYDASGPVDYLDLLDEYDEAAGRAEAKAGLTLLHNLQDRSYRSGLNIAGWKSWEDAHRGAVEWYAFDYSQADTPDVLSEMFSVTNHNTTYNVFSDVDTLAVDPRGYASFIRGLASEYLAENDSRLLLNTIVKDISYNDNGVVISNHDGTCISAEYAITTFSLGVLQSGDVSFTPSLPDWKREAIETFKMGIYTKIFLQFPPDQVFWNKSTQFFLYASETRGYYPVFQNLDHEDFLPGSGIIFVTCVTQNSYVVEQQDDEVTKQQILTVLREMFGNDTVPEPIDFLYQKWGQTPWAYGSYSNWPVGLSLEGHQNLRANTGRVWYAGEATSAPFYGYLQGAYFEGQSVASSVATCLHDAAACVSEVHYDKLEGTTDASEYTPVNGWTQSSFD